MRARGRSNLASPLNALESIKIIGEACRYLERGGWISIVTKRVDPDVYPEKLARWRQGLGMCAQILTTANRDAARFSVPRAHAPFGQAFHVRRYHGVRLRLDLFGHQWDIHQGSGWQALPDHDGYGVRLPGKTGSCPGAA